MNKINILGQYWEIEYWQKVTTKDGEEVDGLAIPEKLQILISIEPPEERQKEVMLHEIIHAVDSVFDIELTEDQVCKLARELFGSLRDTNPQKWIFSKS